jgi:hypothetical protein
MNLTDAKFDVESGDPIVPGEIWADPLVQDAGFTGQGLVVFRTRPIFPPRSICFDPIIEVEGAENGFNKAHRHGYRFNFFDIYLSDIENFLHSHTKTKFISRGGHRCGKIDCPDKTSCELAHYTVRAAYGQEGAELAFDARTSDSPHADREARKWANRRVSIKVLLKWEVLHLLGSGMAAPYWKYEPKPSFPALHQPNLDVRRDPLNIGDLLILQGLAWPLVPGRFEVSTKDKVYEPDRFDRRSLPFLKFLVVHLSERDMSFSDANAVQILENGFFREGSSNYWVTIQSIGWKYINDVLLYQSTASFSAAGDGLGRITYRTGCETEPSDALGRISQRFRKTDISATVSRGCINLTIQAELREFDDETIAFHRERRSPSANLRPYSQMSLSMELPKALLGIRGFTPLKWRRWKISEQL